MEGQTSLPTSGVAALFALLASTHPERGMPVALVLEELISKLRRGVDRGSDRQKDQDTTAIETLLDAQRYLHLVELILEEDEKKRD